MRRTSVWEDEGLHVKSRKKKQAQGIWSFISKKIKNECRIFSDKYYDEP